MKREEIERLLALYYDGRTCEADEERLRQALAHSLPPGLEAERDLFLSLHRSDDDDALPPVPAGLEARLEAAIDRRASAARRLRLRWAAIAASLLLAAGLGLGLAEMRRPAVPQDTFTNPEDAHRALQAIFAEIAQTWGEGMEQLEASQRDIMAANREIRNELMQCGDGENTCLPHPADQSSHKTHMQ